MNLFGFELIRKNDQPEAKTFAMTSVVDQDDINVTGIHGSVDQVPYQFMTPDNEQDRIQVYRDISNTVEVGLALNEIFNEIFIFNNPDKIAFDIDFYSESTLSTKIKDAISKEVTELYHLINFEDNGVDWFSQYYIDSKFIMQLVIDEANPKNGITQVIPLDCVKIRKVKMIPTPDPVTGLININEIQEFYIYSDTFSNKNLSQTLHINTPNQVTGLKISADCIVQTVSGLRNPETEKTIGYLDKAILPFNSLKMMEEAMVIFRVIRAPMRRAFYVDTGGMQPARGQAFMMDMMKRFKNKAVYNSKTGTFNQERHIQSMMEDYWLPRSGDKKTTEVQNLDGQFNQEILDEVEYHRDKLWRALNVPISRFEKQSTFAFGESTEIQRDEYRFSKFLAKIRNRFMIVMDETLKRQLILKRIIKEEDWFEIKKSYFWTFAEDNLFIEYKNAQKLNTILTQLDEIKPYIGDFFSRAYVQRNVLKLNEEQVKQMDDEMAKEPKPLTDEDNLNGNV